MNYENEDKYGNQQNEIKEQILCIELDEQIFYKFYNELNNNSVSKRNQGLINYI